MPISMLPDDLGRWLLGALLAVCGSVVGSFTCTFAMRHSEGRRWLRGRSACDGCERGLAYYETIPILSYVAKLGKCSSCSSNISWLHPVSELWGAAIAASIFEAGLTYSGFVTASTAFVLLFAAVSDILTLRIPNLASLTVAGLGAASALVHQRFLASVLLGVTLYAALILCRFILRSAQRRDSFGGGDIKLMAGLAIGLGPVGFWPAAATASGLALAWLMCRTPLRNLNNRQLPFAPFLGLGWGAAVVSGLSS